MDAIILERAEELAKSIAGEAKTIEDLNGVMKALMKSALERMLGSELSVHLREELPASEEAAAGVAPVGSRKRRNRRNGTRPKVLGADFGGKPLRARPPRRGL